MWFGFHSNQSGHGALGIGSLRGFPGRAMPSAASTRSTVDSDTCTRSSREPRCASLRCDRSISPQVWNNVRIAARSAASRPCSGAPPGARSVSSPHSRRCCQRASRESSTPSLAAARRGDHPASTAWSTRSSRPALTHASTRDGTGPAGPDRGTGGDGRGAGGDRPAAGHGHRAGRGDPPRGGKSTLGLSAGPVPSRVDACVKAGLLDLVDHAVDAGWSSRRAAARLGVDDSRLARWQQRWECGELTDRAPGGAPLHGLLAAERAAILTLFHTWGEIDRSHRKLAHRGSRLDLVHVSESTVLRVLAAEGIALPGNPRRDPIPRAPWPDWLEWKPNHIWAYDFTHFTRARRAAIAILDMVSRKWLTTLVAAEESSTQVEVAFTAALDAEGMSEAAESWASPELQEALNAGDDDRLAELTVAGQVPLLLAVSDNGPQMRSYSTREFMAALAIAQQFGRPSTPTDQAWIETLFGHVKGEWPHLEKIRDPGELERELDRVRAEYNAVRLHASIGYVTHDDEHQGRGEAIRQV